MTPWLSLPARDLHAEAVRRRIAARLFGESHEPVKLGRFRILETLGAGGMGVVHAAEDEKLKRIVALKVIREDLLQHPDERTRLLREARTLARLSHPNVVQVHEVVDTDDSIFIVMEYVPGDTLHQWLRSAHRSLPDILRTFVAAGRGLAAAHRIGIVHRDFKPSNVIVGEARVCILDFGLARGVQATPEPATADSGHGSPVTAPAHDVTATGQLAGTPGYMSPEHILGHSLDARSDQFSFCIALHEALYERRPFEPDELHDHLRRGAQPRLPSVASRRRIPRWLRGLLVRGLALHPRDRFPAMEALLAALEHGMAAPRRYLQLGLAGFMMATTGAVVLTQSPAPLDPCPDASDQLTGIWDPDIRTQVRDAFLASKRPFAITLHQDVERSLDDYASEWLAARHDACAATLLRGEQSGDLMDRRMSCLAQRRDQLSVLSAMLQSPDPELLASADKLVRSLPNLLDCRKPPEPADGRSHSVDPSLAPALGKLERAKFLHLANQVQEAIPLVTEVVDTVDDAATRAEALLLLGAFHGRNLRRSEAAITYLDDAYNHATRAGRPDLIAQIWTELAFVHAHGLQRPAEARRLLERARSALQSNETSDPLAAVDVLDVEGHILRVEGEATAARDRHRQALALRQQYLPPGHPRIATSQIRVANAASDDGDFAEALQIYEALLAEQRERLGDDHPRTANIAIGAAQTYIEMQQHGTAEPLLLRARPPILATYGPDSPQLATVDLALAQVEHAAGKTSSAIERLTHALSIFEANFPPNHSERVLALSELMEYHRITRDSAAALEIHLKLLELHDHHGIEMELPLLLANLGEYLCETDHCLEGYYYLERLKNELKKSPPQDAGLEALPLYGFGIVHLQNDQASRALPLLERAVEIFEAHPDSSPHFHASAARHLATCLQKLRRSPSRVRQLLARAAKIEATLTAAP